MVIRARPSGLGAKKVAAAPRRDSGHDGVCYEGAMPALSERKLVFLLACVQFVNIVDFMMVMPMGPTFAVALGIPVSRLGVVISVYTAAAALAGVLGAMFLDRFDRKRASVV